MKTIIILLLLFSYTFSVQAKKNVKKDAIVVLPSSDWCIYNNYVIESNKNGIITKRPDYQKAIENNNILKLLILNIKNTVIERGFGVLDTKQALLQDDDLKNIEKKASNKFDYLSNNIDIIFFVSFEEKNDSVIYCIEVCQQFGGRVIATGYQTLQRNFIYDKDLFTKKMNCIDNLLAHLMAYYEELFTKGREIKFTVIKLNESKLQFTSEFEGKELSEIINEFVKNNSAKNNFSVIEKNNNIIQYQLRIPLFDDNEKDFNVTDFVEKLRKYLKKSPYNIVSKSETKYKYEAILIF